MRKSNKNLSKAGVCLTASLAITAMGIFGVGSISELTRGLEVQASNEQSVYVNLKGGKVDNHSVYQLDGTIGETVKLPVPTKQGKTLIGYTCSEGYISVTEYGEYYYTYGDDDGVLKAVWLEDIPKESPSPTPTKSVVVTATPKPTAKVQAVATLPPSSKIVSTQVGKTKSVKADISLARSIKMGVDETCALKYEVSTSDEAEVTIEDESILEYDETDNTITALKTGICDVVVSVGDVSAKMIVKVLKEPTRVALDDEEYNEEATYKLKRGTVKTIPVYFEEGCYSNKVTFRALNKKVATCTSTGKIKAIRKGKTKIIIKTYNNKKAVVTVKVTD